MSELKDRKDALEAREKELIDEFLATASVVHELAPLRAAVSALEKPKKDEESK